MTGCRSSRPTAYVVIHNENGDPKAVNVSIAMSESKERKPLHQTELSLEPGLQFLPGKKYKKGTYQLTVGTKDGSFSITQPISMDTDRWIIINYAHGDSANIVKNYGFLDTDKFKVINGKYANLDLYVENRRPPNL
ncbi:hypothetical protein [Sediminibacterium ginsengisoli]|nr:hypothetical protein [Sediminibacterium ginsengisoli]